MSLLTGVSSGGSLGGKQTAELRNPLHLWWVNQPLASLDPDALPASSIYSVPQPLTQAPCCMWWVLCVWIYSFLIAVGTFQTLFRPKNPFLPNQQSNKHLSKMLANKIDQGRAALAEKVLLLPWWGSFEPLGLLEAESEHLAPLLELTHKGSSFLPPPCSLH